jgi:alpha-galactosidase
MITHANRMMSLLVLAGIAAVGLLALGQALAAEKDPPPPPVVATNSPQVGKSPVKVFILAGQSNMEGHGTIKGPQKGTLETFLKDPASADRYKHLVGKDGKWIVRDDVWCVYWDDKGSLTPGRFAGSGNEIGPELGIGLNLGNYLDNQVLLIKVAVGGTSLAGNWRPPSSGGTVGDWYLGMIRRVKEQLKNLKADFPHYDGKGVEIAGFCWHQGWQDGCGADMANEYETNMVNFIKDVRKDLGVPNMPFVIGGSGFGGWGQTNDRRLKIMQAQEAAAGRPEFKGNVLYVETRDFFRDGPVSPRPIRYHWCCNFESYYLIGDGMGKAMVELLGGPKAPANPTGPSDKK